MLRLTTTATTIYRTVVTVTISISACLRVLCSSEPTTEVLTAKFEHSNDNGTQRGFAFQLDSNQDNNKAAHEFEFRCEFDFG